MPRQDKKEKRHRHRHRWAALALLLPIALALWAAVAGLRAQQAANGFQGQCCQQHNTSGAAARAAGIGFLYNMQNFLLSDTYSVSLQNALLQATASAGVWSTQFFNIQGATNQTNYLGYAWLNFNNQPYCYNLSALRTVFWDYRASTLVIQYDCVVPLGDVGFVHQDRLQVFRFDCANRIVYQRMYYLPTQTDPLYADPTTAPCDYCTCAATDTTTENVTSSSIGVQRFATRAKLRAQAEDRVRTISAPRLYWWYVFDPADLLHPHAGDKNVSMSSA